MKNFLMTDMWVLSFVSLGVVALGAIVVALDRSGLLGKTRPNRRR